MPAISAPAANVLSFCTLSDTSAICGALVSSVNVKVVGGETLPAGSMATKESVCWPSAEPSSGRLTGNENEPSGLSATLVGIPPSRATVNDVTPKLVVTSPVIVGSWLVISPEVWFSTILGGVVSCARLKTSRVQSPTWVPSV